MSLETTTNSMTFEIKNQKKKKLKCYLTLTQSIQWNNKDQQQQFIEPSFFSSHFPFSD
jgi:hypothetical protein